ncbi:MAG: carbon-nitrogen hydrolase family protein [Acidobacteria bacterium]|nr:carbon-nitrogen hydrolase family protein [Acidobacteriota bacterium]
MGNRTGLIRWILSIALIACAHEDTGKREEWQIWSPRQQQKPTGIKLPDGSLILTGSAAPAAAGGWVKNVNGIQPGLWFRFEAEYQVEGLSNPRQQVLIRLQWRDAKWDPIGDPEYAWREERSGPWTRVWEEVQAPANAKRAELQLWLYDAQLGTVVFRNPAVELTETPAKRPVRLASLNFRPSNAQGGEANIHKLVELSRQTLTKPTDLLVFGEGVTVVGSSKKYAEVAEPANGYTAKLLGQLAREKNMYVVAGIYESDGDFIYNTAILLDRKGNLAGKYRKVMLPREEIERGLSPGNAMQVFDTDFGKLGIMICYDVFFSEPTKSLAMQGAEVVAMPIWGGNEWLAKARSIEGRFTLVSSGYDHPTYIQDPNGDRLSQASQNATLAYAEIDLAKQYREKYLGDMRARRMRETRLDLKILP